MEQINWLVLVYGHKADGHKHTLRIVVTTSAGKEQAQRIASEHAAATRPDFTWDHSTAYDIIDVVVSA